MPKEPYFGFEHQWNAIKTKQTVKMNNREMKNDA